MEGPLSWNCGRELAGVYACTGLTGGITALVLRAEWPWAFLLCIRSQSAQWDQHVLIIWLICIKYLKQFLLYIISTCHNYPKVFYNLLLVFPFSSNLYCGLQTFSWNFLFSVTQTHFCLLISAFILVLISSDFPLSSQNKLFQHFVYGHPSLDVSMFPLNKFDFFL